MLHAAPYAELVTPPADSVARHAERLARGRRLFVVAPSGLSTLRSMLHPHAAGLREIATEPFGGFVPMSAFEYRERTRPKR